MASFTYLTGPLMQVLKEYCVSILFFAFQQVLQLQKHKEEPSVRILDCQYNLYIIYINYKATAAAGSAQCNLSMCVMLKYLDANACLLLLLSLICTGYIELVTVIDHLTVRV